MRLLIASIGLLAGMSSAGALNAPPEPGPLAVKIVETYVVPLYRQFDAAAAAQSWAWQDACKTGDYAAKLDILKQAYQGAADGWASVEHITTGPISVSLRADRIFFTSDRRNAVAKALADLENKATNRDISPEVVKGVSVAGQGLPAIERLLWEPGSTDVKIRCRVGVAIAKNLAAISYDVVQEWTAEKGPLANLKAGKGDPIHFADPAQAAARLMTDLAGGFQRVDDMKLLAVLGSSADAARPKAAEGWRSGRSTRAIALSTRSLLTQAKIFADASPNDVAAADAKLSAAAWAAVQKLPDDLGEAAADPKRRKLLEDAIAALKAVQNDVVKSVAPSLGISIGFNALDGD